MDFSDAHRFGLGASRFDLVTLADVRCESDHIGAAGFLEPAADDRSIQSTRIRQNHLGYLHASSISIRIGNVGCPESRLSWNRRLS